MPKVSNQRTSAVRHPAAEWAFNLVVLVFATSTIAQPFVIPTASMESTLMTGDHVIVDKLAFAPASGLSSQLLPYKPIERGNVIVFRWPVDIKQTYVKRVVGIPGDRIRIVNKQVIRNGQPMVEPCTQHIDGLRVPFRDDFPLAQIPLEETPSGIEMLREHQKDGEIVVPEGHFFAMGDNRDNSSDSRFWGFVPRENITGTPFLVYWSYEATTEDLMSYSPEHLLDVAFHFFTKTRWDRTFHRVQNNCPGAAM